MVVNARVSGLFYKAVVQAVLIYGSDTLVLTPRMVQTLGPFHHRVHRSLIRQQPR